MDVTVQPSGGDDGPAVTAACASVAASGGGTVTARGVFTMNTTPLISGRVRLDAYGATFRAALGSNLDAVLASPAAMTTSSGHPYDAPITIAGLTVDGNSGAQSAGTGVGILLASGASSAAGQTTIKDCRTSNTRGTGICLTEVNLGGYGLATGPAAPYTGEARLIDCSVYGAGAQGIWQRGGGLGGPAAMTDGFMARCVVGYCTHDGIRVDSAGGWDIDAPHPYGCGLSGILVQGSYSTRIRSAYIEGFGVLDSVAHYAASPSFVPATTYAAATTYALNDVAILNGIIWKSKTDANTGHQPDMSPAQWGAYAGGGTVAGIRAIASNSPRPLTINGNQISPGHASWGLNPLFKYAGVHIAGPATGISKATVYLTGNDIANEIQPAGSNTTAITLTGAGTGPSGVTSVEAGNSVRGAWTTVRS